MTKSGISIIILTLNGAKHLKRLLETFFETNTHAPVELIIIDHGSTDKTAEIVSQYATRAFIRLINRGRNHSFASSCNLGASKARHPHLLFLNNHIIYTSDVLPVAMAKLEVPTIGAVGVRLDDDSDSIPTGKEARVQHTGIAFKWDSEKEFYRPVQIGHKRLAQAKEVKSSFYPAVTGAFLLCHKGDFEKLGGFCEEYDYGFEDIDFCLLLALKLNRKCWCINDMSLQHIKRATRKLVHSEVKKSRRPSNDALFKHRMGEHVKRLMGDEPAPEPSTQFSQRPLATPAPRINPVSLNILFVLYQSIDSNGGLNAQLHAARLMTLGADCLFAVPKDSKQDQTDKTTDPRVHTFAQIEKNGLAFADGRGPDIIHAWTPREIVRIFCKKLLQKHPCPLVIHLEDNEEYLTEVTVGRPFAELAKLPGKELEQLIPAIRYHPIHGRKFLEQAQGLTMIIDTLGRFNYTNVPSLVLPPPVDEHLFYPRPLNLALRKELGISDGHVVLAYTGNVHAGNRDEVRELYRAVSLLNEQGYPTVLIRTGINAEAIGDEAWITAYEQNLGWVERSRVPDILAAADVLVQPGTPGPFNDQRIPSKLPEFFAMGRPVILPRTNLGLKVEHEQEGYVLDKADGEGIARAVLKIRKEKKLADRLAGGGVKFCLQNDSDENFVAQLFHHYYGISNKLSTTSSVPTNGNSLQVTKTQQKVMKRTNAATDNSTAKDMELIRNSGFFDPVFYCQSLPDVTSHNSDPLFHFCHRGWREGRNPNAKFNVNSYLHRYPDVKSKDINPVVHYLLYGWHKGYDPTPCEAFGCRGGLFDINFYRAQQLASLNGMNESEHYLSHGMLKGTAPNRRVAQQRLMRLSLQPLISILMPVFNTPPRLLREAVDSVLEQIYEKWELFLIDDCSTKQKTLETLKELAGKDRRIHIESTSCNSGISVATNTALKNAKGEFVAMIDHDDLLTPDCLLEVASAHNHQPEADVFYSDQSYVDNFGNFTKHHYKPDWAPWMFRGVMYVGHLLVVRRNIAVKIGGFDPKFDFVQDFEFMLRVSEHTDRILHIPKALYHWRQTESSVAGGGKSEIDFGKLQSGAVNAHLKRIAFPVRGKVHPKNPHRLVLEPTDDAKSVPVRVFLLPTHNRVGSPTETSVSRLVDRTTHPNMHLTYLTHVDLQNPSRLIGMLDEDDIELWAFVNDRCQPADKDWLCRLASLATLPGVGAVGPVLIGTNRRVASAGMALTRKGVRHIMQGFNPDSDGYAGSLSCLREVSALSPDCIVLRKELFRLERGLLPEYGLAFNLLDTSFRGRRVELASLVAPYIQVYGFDPQYSSLNVTGLGEQFWMNHRSRELATDDPFYNLNLDPEKCDYTIVDQTF